ncbi:MAG: helix-turn-helix domain-containing protein [Thermoanaerobaculia bacterium]
MTATTFRELFREAEKTLEYNVEGSIMDFTEDLCRVMAEKNVSRAELARRIGTSPAYVTKILRGSSNFTLSSMVRVAMALESEVRIHLSPRGAMTRWIDDLPPVTERASSVLPLSSASAQPPREALIVAA